MIDPNRFNAEEAGLSRLLREARPIPGLPPGFQTTVWRRLERAEADAESTPESWFEGFATALLHPRWVLAGLGILMLAGAILGVAQGREVARDTTQARYLAAVDPLHSIR